MITISGFLWNGYFLLSGIAGIRHSDFEPSTTEVKTDSVLIRQFLLLIPKMSNSPDPLISHIESSQEATGGHR